MKPYHLLLAALGLLTTITRTDASTLFASTSAGGAGELYILSAADGSTIQDVGPLTDSNNVNYAMTGLAFHPTTGVLYGSTGNVSGQKLVTINPATAAVTVVGNYNVGTGKTMTDLAFDPSGNLFGISSSGGANLYSINTSTGQATQIGSSGVAFTQGGGLAISPGGVFYSSPINTEFGTYDPGTGVYSNLGNATRPGGSATSYGALAFDGNTLYGMNLASPPHLVIIDTNTVGVTDLGTTVGSLDGIAFQPTIVSQPTLTIQSTVGGVILGWPASATGFRLLQNSNLLTTNWIANTNPTNVVGGTNQVTISPATGTEFYRLINP